MKQALTKIVRGLLTDAQGVSVVEFALMLPILVMVGAGGLEMTNYVLANQKIERIASVSADNVARNTLAPSEKSIVDTFSGVEDLAAPFDFGANGKVILTGVIGVSQNGVVVPKVVWQRCTGQLASATSSIGSEAADPAAWAEGPNATLPNNIAIMQNQLVVVAEVAYRYQPLISLAQLPNSPSERIFRQQSVFVSRGQAFPYVTPSSGVEPARCNS